MQLPMIKQWTKDTAVLNFARVSELACEERPRMSPLVCFAVSPAYRSNELVLVLLNRRIAESAFNAPNVSRVEYNFATNRLTVTGGKTQYALVNQATRLTRAEVKEQLVAWSAKYRKSAVAKIATPIERKAVKIMAEIAKLEKQIAKLYLHKPVNPLIPNRRESNDYYRDSELTWTNGKTQRKQLARLTGVWIKRYSRPDSWKQFYQDAARIIGREAIPDTDQHSRVCARRDGPDIVDYLKQLPVHVANMRKPFRYASEFDAAEIRRQRSEYVATLAHANNLRSHIANLIQARNVLQTVQAADTAAQIAVAA